MPNVIAGLFLLFGCVASRPELPQLVGDPVPIVFDSSEIPAECWSRGRIHAVDGHAGDDRFSYDGTRERALLRLQYEAKRQNANLILRFPDRDSAVTITDAGRGFEIRVEGEAFSCPGEWIEAKPEAESGAKFLERKLEKGGQEGLRPSLDAD